MRRADAARADGTGAARCVAGGCAPKAARVRSVALPPTRPCGRTRSRAEAKGLTRPELPTATIPPVARTCDETPRRACPRAAPLRRRHPGGARLPSRGMDRARPALAQVLGIVSLGAGAKSAVVDTSRGPGGPRPLHSSEDRSKNTRTGARGVKIRRKPELEQSSKLVLSARFSVRSHSGLL